MLRQSLRVTFGVLAVLLLVACSSRSSDADGAADTPAEPAAVEARQPTILDDQLKALDKARAVEETLQKAQAERDKEIDEQSGG